MTRAESLSGYTVVAGRITNRGKFEGAQVYAPYYYEYALDGIGDDVTYDGDTTIDWFRVGPLDLSKFPELEGVPWVCVFTDGCGFAYVEPRTEADHAAALAADLESDAELA